MWNVSCPWRTDWRFKAGMIFEFDQKLGKKRNGRNVKKKKIRREHLQRARHTFIFYCNNWIHIAQSHLKKHFFSFYLKGRKTNVSSSSLLPKWLQWLGLGQTKTGSWKSFDVFHMHERVWRSHQSLLVRLCFRRELDGRHQSQALGHGIRTGQAVVSLLPQVPAQALALFRFPRTIASLSVVSSTQIAMIYHHEHFWDKEIEKERSQNERERCHQYSFWE